jgi:hypothetical protein
MKTIYKIKVTIKIGEVDSVGYTVINTVDNGINDGKEVEILFETISDYIKSLSDLKKPENSFK